MKIFDSIGTLLVYLYMLKFLKKEHPIAKLLTLLQNFTSWVPRDIKSFELDQLTLHNNERNWVLPDSKNQLFSHNNNLK